MSIPVQSYRKWAKLLEAANARYHGRDAKNHHVWSYIPKGETVPQSFAFTAHNDGAEVLAGYITSLRRAWKLRPKDGVSDHDFMNGNWLKDKQPDDESSRGDPMASQS